MEELLSFSFLKVREDPKPNAGQVGPPPMIRSMSSRVSNIRDAHEVRLGLLMPDSPITDHQREMAVSESVTLISAIDPSASITVLQRDSRRARYHIFISHTQTEASGDVGTLFFLFEQMGVHGWRDMNQPDLTEEGMRRGVYDSDVFILFLTNSYLSRKFCLAEIQYALEFDKPIIIVSEQEERFWPFDLQRWRDNRCSRVGGEWTVGGLQTTYEACPPKVRELIEKRAADGSFLPFRRRDFEVNALIREIVSRASRKTGIAWGAQMPPPAALLSLDSVMQRDIFIFARESEYTAQVVQECKASIDKFAPNTRWVDDLSSAEHVVMLLSRGSVDAGTRSAQLLEQATDLGKTVTFLYVTSIKDEEWDFNEFYDLHGRLQSKATDTVCAHEALKYRDMATEEMCYEHDAMILEILKRMRTSGEEWEGRGGESLRCTTTVETPASPTRPRKRMIITYTGEIAEHQLAEHDAVELLRGAFIFSEDGI